MMELNFSLLQKAKDIYLTFTPLEIDISKIQEFSEKFSSKIEDSLLESLGDEIYNAISLLTDYKSIATFFYDFVKLQYEKQSGGAYFVKAPLYLRNNEIKYSSAACEHYISVDEDCITLKNLSNQWSMFRDWLDNKRKDFYEKLMWVKKKLELMKVINGDVI